MKIERKLQVFNEKRRALLAEVEALEPAVLVARPVAGKWSILEIVEHLVLAERSVFQVLAEPSQLRSRKPRPVQRFRHGLVLLILRYGFPVRVPAPAMLPQGGRDLAELRRMWDEGQGWIRAYLDGAGPEGARRAVLMHPIAGPISVEQAVFMNQLHLDSHARQIATRRRLATDAGAGL
jgi:DinB superfamily